VLEEEENKVERFFRPVKIGQDEDIFLLLDSLYSVWVKATNKA
jgi:hypothetical protein